MKMIIMKATKRIPSSLILSFLLMISLVQEIIVCSSSTDSPNASSSSSTSTTTEGSIIGSCGPKFPYECTCGHQYYDESYRYTVNCTNLKLTNTSILEYMPEETQVLIFVGNNIPELPWNVFGAINNYNNLEIIDMSNNHIYEIRGKSYHHVQNVKRLILNHNNLSISRYDYNNDNDEIINHHHPRVFSNFLNLEELHLTDAFLDNTSAALSDDLHDIFMNSNLTKLKKLHLEQNEITHFNDHNVFCDLPSLTDLYLGDNYLNEINFNIECLKNLRFLDLQRNKFENFKIGELQLLDKLESDPIHINNHHQLVVDFNLNPLICDCNIIPLHIWMKITTVIIRNKENLMCYNNHTVPELIETIEMSKCSKDDIHDLLKTSLTASTLSTEFNSNSNDKPSSAAATETEKKDARTITLVFLLTVLCFVLFALIITLIYLSRDRIKYLITPVLDSVSKKVHYTTIKDEDCPEVSV